MSAALSDIPNNGATISLTLAFVYVKLGEAGATGNAMILSDGKSADLLFICCCKAFIAAYNTTKYSASSGNIAIALSSLALTVVYWTSEYLHAPPDGNALILFPST